MVKVGTSVNEAIEIDSGTHLYNKYRREKSIKASKLGYGIYLKLVGGKIV